MSRRRIWSETVPYEVLGSRDTLGLARRYGLELLVAVLPADDSRLPDLLRRAADAGVPVAVWPQLGDDEGRWLNAGSAACYARRVVALVDDLQERGLVPEELVVDLEPAIGSLSRWLSWLGLRRKRPALPPVPAGYYADAVGLLRGLIAQLRASGIGVSAAFVPLVLLDPPERAERAEGRASPGGWQWLLGTPIDGMDWDHASGMAYTSLFEGWSRRLLSRGDAAVLLEAAARSVRARFGPAAGLSLGVVGTGALGDEPTYGGPSELAEDVAVARACGVDTLSLFDLGGVLTRAPAERWLDAFVHTPPALALPHVPAKLRAALVAGRTIESGARTAHRVLHQRFRGRESSLSESETRGACRPPPPPKSPKVD